MKQIASPRRALWLMLGCCIAILAQAEESVMPQRIVSIGQCTDQLLLVMAQREQIASLTYVAADPDISYMAEAARGLPLNHAGTEEVISFKPDLVIGSTYAARDTAELLRVLGYRVELTEPPDTLAGVGQQILQVGAWIGAGEKAAALTAEMKRRLADIQARYAHRPQRSILVYSPNGYTIGSNTLEDDIFRAAGFRNLAAEMGVTGFQTISLEQLVAAQPDFILIDNYIYNQNSLASAYIHHPVLDAIVPMERRLYMPTRLRDCAGPMVVDAIEYLASHR